MSEFKGTPGPWNWVSMGDYHELMSDTCQPFDDPVIDDGSAGGEYSPSIDVNSHDAKLIAAAPELLEALQELLGAFSQLGNDSINPQSRAAMITHCRAAIAKALGESK